MSTYPDPPGIVSRVRMINKTLRTMQANPDDEGLKLTAMLLRGLALGHLVRDDHSGRFSVTTTGRRRDERLGRG
jgi:hypothetical protein